MANEVAFSIISQGRCHEHVLKSMVEAGAIPYLVKLLIQDQISSRTLLTKLVEHEEDISQLLSAHLLPALRGRIKEWFTLFDHYTSLLRRLTPTASVNQLLPLFAFLFHWAFFDEVSCCHSLCVVDVQESVGIADLLFDLIKDRSYTELTQIITSSNFVNVILSSISKLQDDYSLGTLHKILSHLFLQASPSVLMDATLLSSWKCFLTESCSRSDLSQNSLLFR
jgi:hypothetical protein